MAHLYVVGADGEDRPPAATERFELVTGDGTSLGGVGLARPAWPLGAIIERDGEKLRVVEIVQPKVAGQPKILVVCPAK